MSSTIFLLAISAAVFITVQNFRIITKINSHNGMTNDIQIECIVDRTSSNDIAFLEIADKANHLIARVYPGMKPEKGYRDNVQLFGGVDDDKKGGNLTVIMYKPSEQDTSFYECRMYHPSLSWEAVDSLIRVHESPITMNTEYKHNDAKTGNQLKVTCTVDHRVPFQVIKEIKIIKKRQHEPIAIIQHVPGQEGIPRRGKSTTNNTEVTGSILSELSSTSYLTIIINKANRSRDSDYYICSVHTAIAHRNFRMETASTYVDIQLQNIRMLTKIKYYNSVTKKIQIECIVDRASSNDNITKIEIAKYFDQVAEFHPDLETKNGSRDNVEVIRRVDGDKKSGKLTAKIHKPSEQDAGRYECRMRHDFTRNSSALYTVVDSYIPVHDSRVTMNTEYTHKDGKTDIQLRVTCFVEHRIKGEVVKIIEIKKQGQEGHIAIIQHAAGQERKPKRGPKRKPMKGPNATNNTRVKGIIRNQFGRKSYLRLIINEPSSVMDSGLYECSVFTSINDLISRNETASINVDTIFQGITVMVGNLKRKMSALKTTVRDCGSKQKKTIQKLKQQSEEVLNQFVKLENKCIHERQQQSNTEEDTTSTTTTPTTTMTTVSTTTSTTTPKTTTTTTQRVNHVGHIL